MAASFCFWQEIYNSVGSASTPGLYVAYIILSGLGFSDRMKK